MEEYFLYLIDNFSLTVFLMSLGVFILTSLIKIPVKRATSAFNEAKRQGINTLIMLIPLVLSFLASGGNILCRLVYEFTLRDELR